MNRKKIIWSIILIVLAGGGLYAYKEYSRTHKDVLRVKPDHTISATGLINEFEKADSIANRKYNGKVLEINGTVKTLEKDEQGFYTIVIGDNDVLSSVRGSIDTTHQDDAAAVEAGSSITIRGTCTGFIKDEMGLGSDVILNRCAVIK